MRFFQSVMIWASLGMMFSANAEAPHVFTYNGRLEKDGVLVSGEVQMRVSLSSSVDPVEEPFWSQEYPVSVQNGAFSILVGEPVQGQPANPLNVDPLSEPGEVFIGVEVGEDDQPDGTIDRWVFIGRKKLTASPYAITADYASRSKGMTIDSSSSFSGDAGDETVPLKITDDENNTLKIDGNDITSTSTLHLQRRSGPLPVQSTNIHGSLRVDSNIDARATISNNGGDAPVTIDDHLSVSGNITESGRRVFSHFNIEERRFVNTLGFLNEDSENLGSANEKICFLSAVRKENFSDENVEQLFPDLEAGWGLMECRLSINGENDWVLSSTKSSTVVQLICTALCFNFTPPEE